MKINAIIRPSVLTEDEAINIKGGINSQNVEIDSSCTDCNCWFVNENNKKPTKPVKQSNPMAD